MNLPTNIQPTTSTADSILAHHQVHNNANAQVNQNTSDILTKVSKTGDTMTGPLVLPADPTQPLQAATKAYVDAHGGGGGSAAWGAITGTLSNQTDLQAALTARLVASNNLSDVASAATSRTNLGLGTMATQSAGAVAITGGTITGLSSPLPIASGGTGATTVGGVQAALNLVPGANIEPAVTAGSTNQYWRGDKTWQDFNTAVRVNRLDQMAAPTSALNMNSQKIQSLLDPTLSTDAATKNYVDGVAQGLSVKAAVNEATTAVLPANTYNNGSGGVGATLTANVNGALTVDSVTVAVNDRVLVKNEATAANNGIYVATAVGDASHPYILTRSTDLNSGAQIPGAFTFVETGTVNAGNGFVVVGAGPFTMGTTAVSWTQFSSGGAVVAGNGLVRVGNVISVGAGSGILATTGLTSVDFTAVQAKNANLDAVSALTTTGFISRTGSSTMATRTLTAGSGRIAITNGGGIAGNPTVDIGMLAESDVTNLTTDLASRVQLGGDLGGSTTSPTVVNLHLSADTSIGHKLTNLNDPVTGQDAATKNYVDTSAVGYSAYTAKGDLIAGTGVGTASRLGVGANGQVLTADSTQTVGLRWTSPLTNPMTTLGDVIYGGAAGAVSRLAGNSTSALEFLTSQGSGGINRSYMD